MFSNFSIKAYVYYFQVLSGADVVDPLISCCVIADLKSTKLLNNITIFECTQTLVANLKSHDKVSNVTYDSHVIMLLPFIQCNGDIVMQLWEELIE